MALMKSLASAIGANKIWVLAGALAAGSYFAITHVSDKIESLATETQVLKSQLESSDATIKALRVSYDELDLRYSKYFASTSKNQDELNSRLDKLDNARGKEGTVAKKPKLAADVAKKQVAEYQERLACVSGNQQACSRLQSLSQGAVAPNKNPTSSQ